jgi:hypothetical protein
MIIKQAREATGTFKSTLMGFLMAEDVMKPAEAIYMPPS